LCDQNAVIAWSHGLQRGAGGAAAAGGGVDASSCGEGWCHPLKLPNNAEPYPACICAANATGKKGGLVAVLLKTDGQGGVVSYWSDVAKGKVADTNPIRFEKEGDAPLQLLACASASCYVLVTTKGALYKITLEPFVAQRLVEPGQGGGYLAWGMSALFGGAAAQDVTIAAVVQAPVGGGSTNKLAVLTSSEVLHWVLTDGKGIKTEFIKKVMLEDANPNGEYQLLDMVAEYDDGKSLHILRRKLNTNRFSIGTANSDNDVWGDFVEVEHTFGEMPQAFADPAGKDPVRLLALAPSVLGLLDTRHGTLTMVELKGGEKGGEKEMLKQWTRYTADAEVEQLSKPNLEGIFGFAANLDGDFPYVVTGKSGGSVYRFTWGEDGVANHTVTGNTDPMQLVSDSLALLNKPLKDQDWAKAKTKGVDSVSQLRKKQLVGLRTQARDLKELLKAKVTELLPEEMPAQEWVKLERQLLKNCELISAAIGLRKHQENCAKRAVPDGNGLGDQHTRAHEIMQAAISKTVADRSEGREFGQDDSDVFYAGGKLEKIGDFLEHLIEVSGGGGGGTGRGIVDVQAVNGIIKAMLEESEKEHGEEGSEAKLLWTSEPKVRDNLMKAHKETKNIVFAPSGARAGQHALVGVLKNDLFQLGQWALDGFADIVGFGGGKADASSTGAGAAAAAAAEYIAVREEVISTFAKDDDTEEGLNRAHELAVRHKDYKTLVQLCEDFNEEEQLEKYSNDFKDDPNFAKEKFQWWFENGKRDKLLQQGDNEMDVLQLFFNEGAKVSERANIQWLHAIQIDDFGSAAKVLNSMAKAELNRTPGNVARLKTLRSLEKLSLTASDINGNGYMSENDKALRLIKAQSYLMESHPTPLPAEVVVLKLAETEPQSGSADGPESERIERSQHHASEFLFPALECWSEQCPDDISLLRKILAHAVYHDRGHLERSKVLVQESILCKTLHMYAEDANNDIPLLQRLGCSTAKEGAKALVNSEEFADIIGGGMLPGDKEELANSIQLAMEHSLEEEDAE